MKKNLPLILSVVLAIDAGLLSHQSASAQATAPATAASMPAQPPSTIIAKGKNLTITRGEIDQVIASFKANNDIPDDALPPGARVQILNQLIDIKLVLNHATDADKAQGKIDGDANFAKIIKDFNTPGLLEKRLKAASMTRDDLRAKVTDEATAKIALTHALGINVTDAEIKDFFESRGPGAYDLPAMARALQICLLTTKEWSSEPLPDETIKAKRKLIDELIKRVHAGEDFATLATKYSEDPFSKDNAGELPPFPETGNDIGHETFALKPGQTSDVITKSDGYHIIKLIEIIPPKKMGLADVSDRIRNFLIVQKKKELAPAYFVQLRKEAAVEIVDPTLKAETEAVQAEIAAEAAAEAAAATAPGATEPAATQPTNP